MIETTTGYIGSSGARLWWKSLDPPTDALPIVLLHGGPGMPSYYLEPLEALAEDRRTVIYDHRGCGRSDTPSDTALFTLDSSVDDLHVLVNELELGEFHLFGHSWGGMLALAYAAAHPERVVSLVLGSPLVSVDAWCADADELIRRLPADVQHGLRMAPATAAYQDAETEFYRQHFCRLDPWPPSLQKTMTNLGTAPYETMWGPNEFTMSGNLRGTDLTAVSASLTVPSLWLCGSQDEARPDTIRRYSELNPLGQYVEFAEGSHCVHLEQSDDYVRTVRDFLTRAPEDGRLSCPYDYRCGGDEHSQASGRRCS